MWLKFSLFHIQSNWAVKYKKKESVKNKWNQTFNLS